MCPLKCSGGFCDGIIVLGQVDRDFILFHDSINSNGKA